MYIKDHLISNEPLEGIKCDVTNCVYNSAGRECMASRIEVGPQYANSSVDTICATFRPEV